MALKESLSVVRDIVQHGRMPNEIEDAASCAVGEVVHDAFKVLIETKNPLQREALFCGRCCHGFFLKNFL